MGFFSWLKKPSTAAAVTGIASTVVSSYNPALGSLVNVVGNAVVQVETNMADAPGDQKAQAAAVVVSASTVTNTKLAQTARTVDIKALIDAIVQLFNVLGIFFHSKPKTLAGPNAPAASPAK